MIHTSVFSSLGLLALCVSFKGGGENEYVYMYMYIIYIYIYYIRQRPSLRENIT